MKSVLSLVSSFKSQTLKFPNYSSRLAFATAATAAFLKQQARLLRMNEAARPHCSCFRRKPASLAGHPRVSLVNMLIRFNLPFLPGNRSAQGLYLVLENVGGHSCCFDYEYACWPCPRMARQHDREAMVSIWSWWRGRDTFCSNYSKLPRCRFPFQKSRQMHLKLVKCDAKEP